MAARCVSRAARRFPAAVLHSRAPRQPPSGCAPEVTTLAARRAGGRGPCDDAGVAARRAHGAVRPAQMWHPRRRVHRYAARTPCSPCPWGRATNTHPHVVFTSTPPRTPCSPCPGAVRPRHRAGCSPCRAAVGPYRRAGNARLSRRPWDRGGRALPGIYEMSDKSGHGVSGLIRSHRRPVSPEADGAAGLTGLAVVSWRRPCGSTPPCGWKRPCGWRRPGTCSPPHIGAHIMVRYEYRGGDSAGTTEPAGRIRCAPGRPFTVLPAFRGRLKHRPMS